MILQLSLEECRKTFLQTMLAGYALNKMGIGHCDVATRVRMVNEVFDSLSTHEPEIPCADQQNIDLFLDHFITQWLEMVEHSIPNETENPGPTNSGINTEPPSQPKSESASEANRTIRLIEFRRPDDSELQLAAEKRPHIILGRQIRVSEILFVLTNAGLLVATAFCSICSNAEPINIVDRAISLVESIKSIANRKKLNGTELCLYVKSLCYVGDGMVFTKDTVIRYWFNDAGKPCNLPVRKRILWCWKCPEEYSGICQLKSTSERFQDKIDDDLNALVSKGFFTSCEKGYQISA